MDQLDEEEQAIEDRLEDELDAGLSPDALAKRKAQLSEMARQSSPKVRRVNLLCPEYE